MHTDTDVIVVGAGPTGLMLAGELRLGGARVTVVERLPEPTGQSRGLGFTARAMEIFDQRGLHPRFGGLEPSPLGHFGGIRFDYTILEGAHFGARGVPQSTTEQVLQDWALDLGARVERGWEVVDVDDHGDSVETTLATPEGERVMSSAYLVGCDGGQSTVRKAVGIDFPGTPATRGMYLADVVGGDLETRFLGERLPGGMVMAAPLREGIDRIIVAEHGTPAGDRGRTPDFSEVADAWQRITGESIHHTTATWVSSFTDATRQAAQYRKGRVFVAGDAAHIHLPAGGQGLSVGVQDAANLGWKLAAAVRGWAPEGLLDTYHDERHPVGERLLMNTRAQGMIFLGGKEADPLRELFGELMAYEDVRRHLAGTVSHLDVRYRVGQGGHPLLGARLPHTRLRADGALIDTAAQFHEAQGVLIDLSGDTDLRELATAWKERVAVVAAEPAGPETSSVLAEARAVLVRPDGYVAWVGADPGDEEPATALRRWFGDPSAEA
ncbi:FAD-dependent monooxygenase [Nocardiopsis sp. YSL2]|uniref:FAD-dependent monooxygenase n=1 Tax=Nocardiopsis sp. YSL2 TaxID=2939492 RepID=UPI0026F4726A|nr:FAD-dependent monooxygenase [Nocardiopsis sp. YSL2]